MLEMQTPRGVVLINSPPVVNGGDVRERKRFAGNESEPDAGKDDEKDDEKVSSPGS